MAKAKAISSPVKQLTDEKHVETAQAIRDMASIVEATTIENNKEKKDLIQLFSEDMRNCLVVDGEVFGNYKIDMGKTGTGGIVEVPLQVTTDPLTAEELVDLSELTVPMFEALFEDKTVATSLGDAAEVVTYLNGLDAKELKKIFKVKGGKVVGTIDNAFPSLEFEEVTVPVTSFFGRMAEAYKDSKEKETDAEVLSHWLKERVKGAVKLGNKKETKA